MFKDIHHNLVKHLLEEDGWVVTHDPLTIRGLTRKIHIDFGAEKIIAAERGEQKIAVEVKSFLGPSLLNDFYDAIGKYELYWDALNQNDPSRILFSSSDWSVRRTCVGAIYPKYDATLGDKSVGF